MTDQDSSKPRQKSLPAIFQSSLVAVSVIVLAACASNGDAQPGTPGDPLEPVNRVVFDVNDAVDTVVLRPVAVTYRDNVPTPVQDGVTNFLRNLRTPVILANEVLQGDWQGAEVAAARLFVNTTVGLGGVFDIAGMNKGYEFRSEDFGQTLAVWGAEPGPYLVLPLLGPSTFRDTAGLVVDGAADPVRWTLIATSADGLSIGRSVMGVVDGRARAVEATDELRATAFDYYAASRSAYLQLRELSIRDGAPVDAAPLEIPDFDEPLDESALPSPAAGLVAVDPEHNVDTEAQPQTLSAERP